mmetsp:Transcript_93865/g.287197  ORF Transcript_93865/g.287197 Transcript_93865/m.287197 type:complete len:310 (-) Transcript_93865:1223-2152(-)
MQRHGVARPDRVIGEAMIDPIVRFLGDRQAIPQARGDVREGEHEEPAAHHADHDQEALRGDGLGEELVKDGEARDADQPDHAHHADDADRGLAQARVARARAALEHEDRPVQADEAHVQDEPRHQVLLENRPYAHLDDPVILSEACHQAHADIGRPKQSRKPSPDLENQQILLQREEVHGDHDEVIQDQQTRHNVPDGAHCRRRVEQNPAHRALRIVLLRMRLRPSVPRTQPCCSIVYWRLVDIGKCLLPESQRLVVDACGLHCLNRRSHSRPVLAIAYHFVLALECALVVLLFDRAVNLNMQRVRERQ